MNRAVVRAALLLAAFCLAVGVTGGVGYAVSMRAAMSRPPEAVTLTRAPPAPRYDPGKPTVAVVLGDYLSEVTDVLGPYGLFAASGAYNVYTVASSRAARTLTGNLDVIPHFSFGDLDARLGRGPEIVVVPALPDVAAPENRPLLAWLQKRAGDSLLFSWCTGAEVLAEAGLLGGRAATAHWADLGRLRRRYPDVRWQRGVRYLDGGDVLSAAGLTAGIDATLYLLGRRHGQAFAKRVAREARYPSLRFVASPQMEPYTLGPRDAVYALNAMFGWRKQRTGVWLSDGIGELELASIFDVYAASWTNRLYTAARRRVVRSEHGLLLVARHTPADRTSDSLSLDRLLISGTTELPLNPLELGEGGVTRLHLTPAFAFDSPLKDLALTHDVPTAAFAVKRLEYRPRKLDLRGAGWPVHATLTALACGLAGVLGTCGLANRIRKKRR